MLVCGTHLCTGHEKCCMTWVTKHPVKDWTANLFCGTSRARHEVCNREAVPGTAFMQFQDNNTTHLCESTLSTSCTFQMVSLLRFTSWVVKSPTSAFGSTVFLQAVDLQTGRQACFIAASQPCHDLILVFAFEFAPSMNKNFLPTTELV